MAVTLSADSGATIRYTTNGADPTAASTAYAQPLTLSTTTTLKAKAFQTDHPTSTTMTQVYTIRAATPTFTLTSGSYDPGTVVSISGDASTTLRITLSGVDPTNTDPVIPSGTSLLVGGYTIKVKAFKTGNSDSNVGSATYSLTTPLSGGSVAAGSTHTVLATPGGLVYGWGTNSSGQVGDSTTTMRTTPKLISTLTGVTKLAAGSVHTLAVTWDGRLYAWGSNGSGRLGDGGTTNQWTPKLITAISNVIAVAAGNGHSLALTASGQVYAWGVGSSGQLGLGNTSSASTPTLVSSLSNIVAIGAGDSHSFAVTSSGQLYAWGYNGSSQLGDGGTTQQTSPKLITGISGVAAVTGGTSHSVARLTSGAAYTWGANGNGQLGQGNPTSKTTPTLMSGLSVGALVSSGSAFGAAVRSDGVLVEWGLNSSGQLGSSNPPTQQTAPTAVAGGPTSVALLATGTTHTVAVTPDGHVWTWGSDGGSQLGDGNTGSFRAAPLDVFTSPGTWGATPVPMLTLAPGTYHSTQTLSVSAMSGAAVHYTTTGATPTESDPVLNAGTSLSITQNTTYGFRAFTPGLLPSTSVVAAYELQPLAPAISPASGMYTSAQSVTLQAESGTTIRYTLDGSLPTTQSTTYTGAISVAVPITVTARAFRAGWTTSTSAAAAYSFVLGAPTINPPGGLYTAMQSVTLQAAPGATIRYTTDGSAPNANSPIYAGAFPVASSLTVRAIASEAGWTDSPGNSQTYTIDSVGPIIAATYFPSPNSAGWNHGPIEVSFFCTDAVTGVLSCPEPMTINAEGAGQQITVMATDVAGNQSSATITVNIDHTPASVTVNAPADASTTTDSSIAVTATVIDNLSGPSTAKCNGTPATISTGSIACQVALQKGVNPVIVQVLDVAGNVASTSVSVTRTGTAASISAVPSKYTLSVDQTASIQIIDDFGQPVTAGWTTSDGAIASVDANGIVSATAVGEATITATAGSLSAEVQVIVLPAGPVPVGTTIWTVLPTGGFTTWTSVGVDRPDSTRMALFETVPDGQGGVTAARMRGFGFGGEETFTTSVPIPSGETPVRAVGDSSGGGIVLSQRPPGYSDSVFTITRVSPEGGSWQHSGDEIEGMAQAADGTVFAVVHTIHQPNDVLSIWGIDGETGQLKFEIPIKTSSFTLHSSGCESDNFHEEWSSSSAATVTVDVNGYANVLAAPEQWVEQRDSDIGGCAVLDQFCSEQDYRSAPLPHINRRRGSYDCAGRLRGPRRGKQLAGPLAER